MHLLFFCPDGPGDGCRLVSGKDGGLILCLLGRNADGHLRTPSGFTLIGETVPFPIKDLEPPVDVVDGDIGALAGGTSVSI